MLGNDIVRDGIFLETAVAGTMPGFPRLELAAWCTKLRVCGGGDVQ